MVELWRTPPEVIYIRRMDAADAVLYANRKGVLDCGAVGSMVHCMRCGVAS